VTPGQQPGVTIGNTTFSTSRRQLRFPGRDGQIIGRPVRRIAGKAKLWNGNRGRWRNFFSVNPEQSVIVWAWTTHAMNRQRYRDAA
jgi:hypothetical protein